MKLSARANPVRARTPQAGESALASATDQNKFEETPMNDATLATRGAATLACALLGAALVAGCNRTDNPDSSVQPSFLVNITSTTHDETNDDLLTGGLG